MPSFYHYSNSTGAEFGIFLTTIKGITTEGGELTTKESYNKHNQLLEVLLFFCIKMQSIRKKSLVANIIFIEELVSRNLQRTYLYIYNGLRFPQSWILCHSVGFTLLCSSFNQL